eukprot:5462508-Heterocapsa_arctica.AAC.1
MSLATASGTVERNARTAMHLHDGLKVQAIIMPGMNMNLASEGRIVSDMGYQSIRHKVHGKLWKNPETGVWTR